MIRIMLAFLLGYFGYSKTLLRYDPGIAAFSVLIMRRSVGSAGAKNLQRLRGVVTGTTVGHVMYAMAGWCSWWGYLVMGVSLFFWVGISLLTHHDHRAGGSGAGLPVNFSAAGTSAGLLSAYFGASGLIQQCTYEVYTVNDILGNTYYNIIDAVVAVGLAFLVDAVMSPEPASQLAAKAYVDEWKAISNALVDVLEPSMSPRPHLVEVARKYRIAEVLGQQAEREPRYWRLPWRSSLYHDAMQSARRLRMSLSGMEWSVVEGGRHGAGKGEKIKKLTALQSFLQMRNVAQEAMEHLEQLLEQVLNQETGDPMRALGAPALRRNFVIEFMQATRAFIQEANRLDFMGGEKFPTSLTSLENDGAAQACLLLSCVASMVAEAQTLRMSVLHGAL